MKKLTTLLLAALIGIPCLAQQMRMGLVKDEDGYTNIRKGPGTKYAIVGKVKDGGYILISGEYDDPWFKVYTQNGTMRGYISAKKVLRIESPEF